MKAPKPAPDLLVRYPEGQYAYILKGEAYVVELRDTMTGSWPCTKEERMAYFLNGFPRFPQSLKNLIEWGGKLTPLAGELRK